MTEPTSIVYIVDDDTSVREAVTDLLGSVGLATKSFGSTQEFLEAERPDAPGCIVLDVRLPGSSGLEFQRVLTEQGIFLPVIFITGHGDIPMSVRAMKAGAIEFLTKPLREQELLDAIHAALEKSRSQRSEDRAVAALRIRFDSLTPRERQVFSLVVAGRANKQIAADLELSEMTVKVHRSQITRKLQAKAVVELVRIADRLGIARAKPI